MSLSKMGDLRELTPEEVDEQIQQLKRELFDLRFQAGTRQTVQPHQAKQIRHTISQLMTLKRERQN